VVSKDKRTVTLVNNITDPEAVSTVLRKNKDGTRSSVSCPESVQRYDSYMGGVDMFDARRKTYSCSRKSRKWWLRLFYFLLDAAVTNAYILYKESNQTPALTMKEFVLKICEFLVASTNCRKRPSVQDPPQQRDCASVTSPTGWTSLSSAIFARKDDAQGFVASLVVPNGLFLFALWVVSVSITRSSI
jgi:hypothetical protein